MPAITEPIPLPELTTDDLSRYSRHLILPEVGMEGQQRLKAAKVLCVGTGGLGSPLAFYLAAAGIGTLGLVDFDVVERVRGLLDVKSGPAKTNLPKNRHARRRAGKLFLE